MLSSLRSGLLAAFTCSTGCTYYTVADDLSPDTDSTDGGGDEQFGMVKIELNAEDPSAPPFAGTTEIVVVLQYGQCLQDFYQIYHPEYQQTGIEGASIFADWNSMLCDSALPNVIDCESADINQILSESIDVYELRVTYQVEDPSDLDGGYIYVGPIPTQESASECAAVATVELGGPGVIGRQQDGTAIWGIAILPASTEATAGQGAPLVVEVEAN